MIKQELWFDLGILRKESESGTWSSNEKWFPWKSK